MPADRDDSLMRAAFAPARALEPSDAEVARVLARATAPARRSASPPGGWRRLAVPGLAALVLLAGSAYAVPSTRAAIDDLADTFTGWVSGEDGEAPGRPLGANEPAPDYFHQPRYEGKARVIAKAGGYRLYAILQPDGSVEFDLGNTGVGLGFAASSFEDRAIYVLGPGSMETVDDRGHVPLFGITADSVTSVELIYESGPSLRVDRIDGGFVLLADPPRGPHEVIAYDRNGGVVASQLVDESADYGPRIDWDQFGARRRASPG